ncbi:uncharacterized protein A4U43_C03F2040 [Asparagus officinalis]|uniref:BED-type domain-containing protein n=1 Tax=Asparagus officinalis TaxID=4686 RepID=A0A5P1F9D9_ASPOF|nr:uncharacterized protein A4U43_C03F2040 [Asparagus officinalis]
MSRPIKNKGFDDTPLWSHVEVLSTPTGGGGNRVWRCKYCNKTVTSSYSKVKGHLLKIPNQGVQACKGITEDIYREIKKENDEAEHKKRNLSLSVKQKQDYISLPEDGWQDRHSKPLVNIMIASAAGPMFQKAIDATEVLSKDAEYLADVKLLKVAETRFGSKIVMATRIQRLKDALEKTVMDPDWKKFKVNGRNPIELKAREVKDLGDTMDGDSILEVAELSLNEPEIEAISFDL